MNTNINMEPKIAYMVFISNRQGVQNIFTTTDPKALNARIREETAKGRKCKVAEREIGAATA